MDSPFNKRTSANCCTVVFVWPQPECGLQAGFSLTHLQPGFHFPPEAASPTVMGADKQVDIAATVVPGATTNSWKGGVELESGEKNPSRAHVDWQELLTQLDLRHANKCFFFPSSGSSESSCTLKESWILLYNRLRENYRTIDGKWKHKKQAKTKNSKCVNFFFF